MVEMPCTHREVDKTTSMGKRGGDDSDGTESKEEEGAARPRQSSDDPHPAQGKKEGETNDYSLENSQTSFFGGWDNEGAIFYLRNTKKNYLY